MEYEYSYLKHLYLKDRHLTKEKFLAGAEASKGYGLTMFSKIYDVLTCELVCVEDIFERYHLSEYERLDRYLYKRYNLPGKVIEEFMKQKELHPNAAIFRWYASAYGDYSISQFVFSETMSDRIETLLLCK